MASVLADGFLTKRQGPFYCISRILSFTRRRYCIDAFAKQGSFHLCCGYHRNRAQCGHPPGVHAARREGPSHKNGRVEIAHGNIGLVPWASELMNSWVRSGNKRLLCCNVSRKEGRERVFCQRCIASNVIGFSLDRPVSTTLSARTSCHLLAHRWPRQTAVADGCEGSEGAHCPILSCRLGGGRGVWGWSGCPGGGW